MSAGLERGGLSIRYDEGAAEDDRFALVGREKDIDLRGAVRLSADDLRWLCVAAGPALLAAHAPLPTPAEAARRRASRQS